MRTIRFGGPEHQYREIHAVDTHHSSTRLGYYGDGRTVMLVCKDRHHPTVSVLGEDGLDYWGEPFRYGDYFLAERREADPSATPDASPHQVHCGKVFQQKRHWQRFHNRECQRLGWEARNPRVHLEEAS